MSRLLVTQYQAEVEKIIRYGGSKKETSIRNAFERLLNDYCKPRNYLLIPELDFKTKFNTTVFPDGTKTNMTTSIKKSRRSLRGATLMKIFCLKTRRLRC